MPMLVPVVRRTIGSRWRFGQALTPVAAILGILARRTEITLLYVTAFAALLAAGVAFLSARRTFRGVEIRPNGHKLVAMVAGQPVTMRADSGWTLDGDTARVYDRHGGWMLQDADGSVLGALLTSLLGPPIRLRRRGSPRARTAALSVACIGALSTATAFGAQSVPLALAGISLFGLGLAFFGALSQKVVDGPTSSNERPRRRADE